MAGIGVGSSPPTSQIGASHEPVGEGGGVRGGGASASPVGIVEEAARDCSDRMVSHEEVAHHAAEALVVGVWPMAAAEATVGA